MLFLSDNVRLLDKQDLEAQTLVHDNLKFVYIIKTKQVGVVSDIRPSGYRIKNIGIVPKDECRKPTRKEVQDWVNR